jgi:oligosaccharide repeat unit polymerase
MTLLVSLLILGQAYYVRRIVGTWLFPACLLGLFWFAITFIPLVLLPTVPIDPRGTAFILLCLIAFSLSAVVFLWSDAFKRNVIKRETEPLIYESSFLKKTFYVLSFVTLVCIVLDSLAQGVSLHDLMYDLIATAAAYREMGSFDTINVTIYDRISEIAIYDVAILGGLLISSAPTKWARVRIVVFSFLPGVLVAVAHSSKWDMFSCIAFFYAGLLVYRIRQGNFQLFNKGALRKAVLWAAILVPITSLSFISRGLQNSDDRDFITDHLVSMFASYSCGHLYAFSDWYTSYMAEHWGTKYHSQITYNREDTTYGMYTFTPVFRFFGRAKPVTPGMFDDYYEYGDILKSNIYTMFRGLIQDFGLIGSLVFMFVAGLLIHWGFFVMLSRRRPAASVAVFLFSVGFFYASFVRSIFDWSGMYFTFVLMWAILEVNQRVSRFQVDAEGGHQAASLIQYSN